MNSQTYTAPFQKVAFIDKTTPPEQQYFKIGHETYFLAAQRLTSGGLTVYMYLMTQIPHTIDSKINPKNKRTAPFALSPSDIAKITGAKTRTIERGINDLIEKGYLKQSPSQKNAYYFIDTLLEDKPQSLEEYKIVEAEKASIEEGIQLLDSERTQQLHTIAQHQIESKQSSSKKNAYHDTWMDDREYWIENEEKSRFLTYNELHSSTYNFINMEDVTDWSRVPAYLKSKRGITL